MKKIERFDQEGVFREDALGKNGISLFLGAGFSLGANDKKSKVFPTGEQLLRELKTKFSGKIDRQNKLDRAATILNNTFEANEFKDFLQERFSVGSFDERYKNLERLNIKNIYTTNIDDLPYKIWENCDSGNRRKYLYDVLQNGSTVDKSAIKFYPVHGCVQRKDKIFKFSTREILGTDNNYGMLREVAEKSSILFWGWNFEDVDVMQQILEKEVYNNTRRWAIVYDEGEQVEADIDWLESEGFNIIKTNTFDFLSYIKDITLETHTQDSELDRQRSDFLIEYSTLPQTVYPPERAFQECCSDWFNVKKNLFPKTHYYKEIENLISEENNVIVFGMPCSGKTTLMRQLFLNYETNRLKHYLEAPSLDVVKLYLKSLGNNLSILFIDDCLADTNAFITLCNAKNVKVIGFCRDTNYERQNSKLAGIRISELNIDILTEADAISIYNKIPNSIRNENCALNKIKDRTIITLLYSFIKNVFDFRFFKSFREKDPVASKVFAMICYCHAYGAPVSFDMIYSFLGDEKYNYKSMMEIVDRIGKLKNKKNINNIAFLERYGNQDFYEVRSSFLASKILKYLTRSPDDRELLKEVIMRFAENVPSHKICNYYIFKRGAYDAKFISDVFFNKTKSGWTDAGYGQRFYEICSKYDHSEYIYQQAALYFSRIRQYDNAYSWIRKASLIDKIDRNTIKMTEAIIRFENNLHISPHPVDELVDCLEKMYLACKNDKRGYIHYVGYSSYALKFWQLKINETLALKHLDGAISIIENSDYEKDIKSRTTLKTLRNNIKTIKDIFKRINL